ncbi:MAG: DNA-processing protein DprA [Solirubrobacterales bacterium]|nr:DNA-processing protein DprA [Solirubrobacterales bacterium]HMT05113.1 DNA-processing protein DprA [Solirubrobacterales bacterium]
MSTREANPGSGVGVETACVDCLRRSWLLGRLGSWIQNVVDDRAGRRTPELLRLESSDLVQVVAAKKADQILSWNASLTEEEMRGSLANADCWSCCRHDKRFPEGFADGTDAPVALIGRGGGVRLEELRMDNSVTVVGARKATGYGLEVAASIGRESASAGLNVISGLALGIDGAVHRGALERGATVAVLGCGADRPYPASHSRLYRQIVDRGLVISEFPPGADAWRWSFPARNRIMAALSALTVVVEAAWKSGSLITAEMAYDAGRDVGAVPGPVTSGAAAGTNELIASGAGVIRGGQDVLDRMLGAGAGQTLFGPTVNREEREVLDAVEGGSGTVDEVANLLGESTSSVAMTMARLEINGYLRGSAVGTWTRTSLAAYPSDSEQ